MAVLIAYFKACVAVHWHGGRGRGTFVVKFYKVVVGSQTMYRWSQRQTQQQATLPTQVVYPPPSPLPLAMGAGSTEGRMGGGYRTAVSQGKRSSSVFRAPPPTESSPLSRLSARLSAGARHQHPPPPPPPVSRGGTTSMSMSQSVENVVVEVAGVHTSQIGVEEMAASVAAVERRLTAIEALLSGMATTLRALQRAKGRPRSSKKRVLKRRPRRPRRPRRSQPPQQSPGAMDMYDSDETILPDSSSGDALDEERGEGGGEGGEEVKTQKERLTREIQAMFHNM